MRIHVWLGVMENYLYVGNTYHDFWVNIAQTYLEVRCYFCEEKCHWANSYHKKFNSTSDKVENDH